MQREAPGDADPGRRTQGGKYRQAPGSRHREGAHAEGVMVFTGGGVGWGKLRHPQTLVPCVQLWHVPFFGMRTRIKTDPDVHYTGTSTSRQKKNVSDPGSKK